MDSIFNDIFKNNDVIIKNRMANKIKEAKTLPRKEFIEALASDYIKLSKEL